VLIVVLRLSWGTWCWFCGMHCHEYMTGYILLYVTYRFLYVSWLHPCMVGCILGCLVTCINHVGWLQELIPHARLHAFMHMCSWLGIAYAYLWLHVAMCTMELWSFSCMRSWFVKLIWSCIDDWTISRMMWIWFGTHVLYVYMQLSCMYGLSYSYAWIVGQTCLVKSWYAI